MEVMLLSMMRREVLKIREKNSGESMEMLWNRGREVWKRMKEGED